MICGMVFNASAQTITETPTNGPTTITVHARTTDGKVPVGVYCTIINDMARWITRQDAPLDPLYQRLPFIGESGDWTATNVPTKLISYEVTLQSANYAEDGHNRIRRLDVKSNTCYSIDFVLTRGATFKGRVLDDATGKPIANMIIFGHNSGSRTNQNRLTIIDAPRSDAEGRYEFHHVAGFMVVTPETMDMHYQWTNYVQQSIIFDAAAEDSTVTVPDFRLKHGGRIFGFVERPAGFSDRINNAGVKAEINGTLPTNVNIREAFVSGSEENRGDFHFRTDPLPPGTYTLNFNERNNFGPVTRPLLVGSISNITVIAGQDTTNVFIPTKMIVRTNAASGR